MSTTVIRIACRVFLVLLVGCLGARAAEPPAETVTVRFELNDARVKNQMIPGVDVRVLAVADSVEVAAGTTDADGRWTASLPRGSYKVTYRCDGYVPYASGATEIAGDGQVVTVSLSRLLEATGTTGRVVRVILNWGSKRDQVKDADSHLACPCGADTAHVFYRERVHEGTGHRVELDVDDTDWGGPETVTLTDPPPGSYLYWVHDYSGPPAILGTSDIVVRVVIGDQEAGEFRVFKGLAHRAWRPFEAIEVGADLRPVVVPFTPDEIAEGADLMLPVALQPPETLVVPTPEPASGPGGRGGCWALPLGCGLGLVVALLALMLVVRAIRTRRVNPPR